MSSDVNEQVDAVPSNRNDDLHSTSANDSLVQEYLAYLDKYGLVMFHTRALAKGLSTDLIDRVLEERAKRKTGLVDILKNAFL